MTAQLEIDMKPETPITVMYHGKPRAALFTGPAPSRLITRKGRFACRVWHDERFRDAGDIIYLLMGDEGIKWVRGWGEDQSAELRAAWIMVGL